MATVPALGTELTLQQQNPAPSSHRRTSRRKTPSTAKMLSRCVLPLLVCHLLVKEMAAFALPGVFRGKREASWLGQDFAPGLQVEVNPGDLSPGDDPWDLEGRRHSHEGAILLLSPHLEELPRTSSHEHQHNRKHNEKRMSPATIGKNTVNKDVHLSSLLASAVSTNQELSIYLHFLMFG
ncbi:hypothetical protein CRUP_001296 [Coryphaenoides rupestris]|nr:hypothetical protein CRUP_001296 [Coryphaenoides rupestris]